jgi:RNA polymerase sigma-70 factor (ECF subfamily)
MLPARHKEGSPSLPAGRFATTHWSLVLAARDQAAPQAREALADLCRVYWYPLYAFIRRQGHAADQAQDLTQEFFARLLEKDFLRLVDRDKGKFRSFLLAACKHFLANQRDRANARKRGGARTHVPIDFVAAEDRYSLEPAHPLTPEKLFARRWALTLLDQVLAQLHEEFLQAEKGTVFEHLKGFLTGTGEKGGRSYGEVAREVGLTEGALRVAVHRLRKRYRELLCAEIARTVRDPGQVEDEVRDLFAALGS